MKSKKGNLSVPASAEAALYFVDDQLLFQTVDGERVTSKLLSAATVRQAFSNAPIDTGWLPRGVSRWGTGSRGQWMVRWHEPAPYKLQLAARKAAIVVPMPALVYFGIGNAYYLWAMKGVTFNPALRLFHAPLANINSSGLICFGQNAHPDVAKGGFEQTWQTFWQAPFNNDHANKKSKSEPENINPKLQELSRRKATTYPADDLVESGWTLNQAIERYTNRVNRANPYSEIYDEEDDFNDDLEV